DCLTYDQASLMSSCARFSAFLASALASASGFNVRMAFARLKAFPSSGARQEVTLPLPGWTAVTSHFKQLNLILRLRLTYSAATHSFNCRNAVQASSNFVRGGKSACSCDASFLLCSLFAASCSLAVGPFLSQWMGLYDCAAAFAATRSTSAAIKPAMIHLFFISYPFASQSLANGSRADASERAGLSLAVGLRAAAHLLLVGHRRQRNFDTFAGRFSPKASPLSLSPVL